MHPALSPASTNPPPTPPSKASCTPHAASPPSHHVHPVPRTLPSSGVSGGPAYEANIITYNDPFNGGKATTIVVYPFYMADCQNAMTPVITDYLASSSQLITYWQSKLGGSAPSEIVFRCGADPKLQKANQASDSTTWDHYVLSAAWSGGDRLLSPVQSGAHPSPASRPPVPPLQSCRARPT